MPAFVNIELYQSLNGIGSKRINSLFNSFLVKNNLNYRLSQSSINKFNQNGIEKITFKFCPELEFKVFTRDLKLIKDWFVLELCIEYEKILFNSNKQTIYKKGMKETFIKIMKLLNQHFDCPLIIITSEIENGYFFEQHYGNGSNELAGFEMALINKSNRKIKTKEFTLLEESESYSIFIQESEYVKWDY